MDPMGDGFDLYIKSIFQIIINRFYNHKNLLHYEFLFFKSYLKLKQWFTNIDFVKCFPLNHFVHPSFGSQVKVGIQHVTIQAEPLWLVTGLAVKSTM